jgi:uncharacterized protein
MDERQKKILDQVTEILATMLKPSRIILFGSRAKNNNPPSSDFDLAVDCSSVPETTKRTIHEKIEQISGLYGVDITYLREAEKKFQEIILSTGKVIYEQGT